MSFALFIIYIVFTYLRPFDTIALSLADYRPMLILWAIAFVAALPRVIMRGGVAARPTHFWLLGVLTAVIGVSQVANRWAGVLEFSTAAMLMVLCLMNLTSLRRLEFTCKVILVCIVALAGLGIASWHTGFMAEQLVLRQSATVESELEAYYEGEEFTAPADDKSGRSFLRLRSVGFLSDPNDFAQAMVMALPLLWWLHVPGRWLRSLVLGFAPITMLGYAIFLTHSRGALVGVASIVMMAMFRVLGAVKSMILILPMLAVIGTISIGGRGLSAKEESAADRIDAWQQGLIMLRNKPVLGVGFGNFTDHHHLTAHNSYVLCFSELGLIGFFVWLGLIVITFRGLLQALSIAPATSPEYRLTLALRASLVAYLVCAWFLSRTYSPGLFVLLALCVAAWFIVRRINGPPPVSEEAPLKWTTATLVSMVVLIGAVYASVVSQRGGA
jgi:putative inorganic carbon (hco3(-)) transporter